MRKLGILGGRFDPIHNGHLILALDIVEHLGLDEMIYLLGFHPPHKPVGTSFDDRWTMLELALEPVKIFRASDIERRLDLKRSYTVSVLEALKAEEGECELYFLLGSDQFEELPKWHQPERFRELAKLVVLKRPGCAARHPRVERIVPDVLYFDERSVEISSSEIRGRVNRGLPIQFFVPEPVEHYIRERGLYL